MASMITLEAGTVRRSIDRTKQKIQEGSDTAVDEAKISMVRYALFLINESASKINNISGDLAAAGVVADIEETEGEIRVPFGFNSPYGAQRDRGGTIFPGPGKRNLAIPLDAAKTPSGIPRLSSPTEDQDLVLLKGRNFLFLAKPPKDRPLVRSDLFYLLVPSVTQEGNRYFSSTIAANREQTSQLMANAVKARLDQ